jgi:hypothetical protein
MGHMVPDRIEVNPTEVPLDGVMPGDEPIPDSSVKDRLQWR